MLLNEIMDSFSDVTVVKLIVSLNREMASSLSGKFYACVKMEALRLPVIEYFRHLKTALAFWMALSSVRLVYTVSMPVSTME